jgi:hypothetical protein
VNALEDALWRYRGPFEDSYVGLAAAIGLRMLAHWWLTRLRD